MLARELELLESVTRVSSCVLLPSRPSLPAPLRPFHPLSSPFTPWAICPSGPQEDILPTCRELGIGVLAYSPLGRGLLAGRFKSAGQLGEADFRRHHMPRFQGANFDKARRRAKLGRGLGPRGLGPGGLGPLLRPGAGLRRCGSEVVFMTDCR